MTVPDREPPPARRVLLVALLLAAAVVVAYLGALRDGFVNFDDDDYVTENPVVRGGLSLKGVRWAFGGSHAANWHPLTWLSHMLDVQLFGLDPAGHHATSVALHALNAALLVVLLVRLTRSLWPAAVAAGLFALHPLRVESVAWVSERKDVLSGTFFLLALLAYERWARRGEAWRYALVVLAFALGLLAKPMLVTLPFVLLLLDLWPLERRPGARLVLEKLPLFALSAASCVVTVVAQSGGGATSGLGYVPLAWRVANAAKAYWAYLGLTLWPAGLAALYPHPLSRVNEHPAAWTGTSVAALALLVLVTAAVLALALRRRALAVGWLWYLGMLVPVIGLVQVGVQAWADRYTYLPSIGLSLLVAYGGLELLRRRPASARPLAAFAVLVLLALAVRTSAQVAVWRDSETLWRHALAVTRANYVAEANLGSTLGETHRVDEAEQHYRAALAIDPAHDQSNNGLGFCLSERGRYDEAMVFLRRALKGNPANWEAHNNVGLVHARLGRYADARAQFERANQLHPGNASVLSNLGGALAGLANGDRALLEQAAARFREALAIDPKEVEALSNLGHVLRLLGRADEAASCFERALAIDPGNAVALENRGLLLAAQGDSAGAVQSLSAAQAAGFEPESASVLARVLATSSNAAVRDGASALRIARECARARPDDPLVLDVLASAQAESGDSTGAATTAARALSLAPPAARAGIAQRLAAYRAGRPWRDPRLR